MKLCSISDLHGILPKDLDECEVLCICGDISPLRAQENYPQMRSWIKKKFIPWCINQKCNKIILIGGNHDGYLSDCEKEFRELLPSKVVYLCNEEYNYTTNEGKVIKFFGTPYCKMFGNWWFMLSPEKLQEKFKNITPDVDVLLTHDAPYGCSDVCFEEMWWNTGEHIGNHELAQAIQEKNPKYNLHGHLHSSNHKEEILQNTKVYNCSIVNEWYENCYHPLYLEFL